MLPGNSVAITEDGAVAAGSGRVSGVVVTAAAATASLILYDNPSAASGTVLLSLSAVADTSVVYNVPFVFSTGVYADIGGAGAAAYVILA